MSSLRNFDVYGLRLCFSLFLVVWTVPGCDAVPLLLPKDASGPVNCAALSERFTKPRWLSLPNSRLVVNPFLGQSMEHGGGSGGAVDGVLPMNLAYYVGAGPLQLPAFWFLQPSGPSTAARGFVMGPRLELSDAAQWQTVGVRAAFGNRGVQVTPEGSFGAIRRTVTVDLDKTPSLVIQTPPGSPSFDIKVSSAEHPQDIPLKPSERLSATIADIPAATGWHGVKTLTVLLYALGQARTTTFTRVQFFGLPGLAASPSAASQENTWKPHEITSQTQVGNAAGLVDSAVTMPDADTVSERLHIGPAGPSALTLAGQFAGNVRWDAARNTLLLQGGHFSAAVSVSRQAKWLGVRPTQLDWALGEESGPDSSAASGVWRMALTGLKPGDDIVIAARFAPSAGSMAQVRDMVRTLATPVQFSAALARNEAAWNRRLSAIPRPLDFTPRSVDAKGVTAADVRRSYYRAWVFFYEDTLPPMPENGFSFPQVCTGKPSLWTDGAPGSEETAVWDSAVAMQALALLEPNTVWTAAQGIMSQVGPDGYLPGELLPTIFAQTFWLLYRQTGDRDKLRAVYPALKRFMVWRIAHPRWVYPNKSLADVKPSTLKDNEFVVHEIVDMGYAIKIANVLGMTDEAAFWQGQRRQAAADYLRWFLPAPGDVLYRLYASDTDRGDPSDTWSAKGLQIDPDLLASSGRQTMLAVFRKNFSLGKPFGISQNRFGDLEPITLGLFGSGQIAEARQMADLAMRDVTRAGDFSEDYTRADPPAPNGVRPSSFGARLMTDSVLWHNGVVLDQGFPTLLGMPGAVGVDNIPVHGDPIGIRFDPAKHTVTLRGPGLARLRLPGGFRASIVNSKIIWTGPIADGQKICLDEKANYSNERYSDHGNQNNGTE